MRISVVMPVYNGAKYLGETLESLWAQTREPFEVIAVDNGSTDGSLEILKAAGHRLRLVSEARRGLAHGRNRGAEEAQGDYVAFLDQDDLWREDKLAVFTAAAEAHPEAGLVYSDAVAIDSDGQAYRAMSGRPPAGNAVEALLVDNFVVSSAAMVKRETAQAAGPILADFKHPASVCDWEFFLRLAKKAPLHYVDQPLTFYRVHAGGAIKNSLAPVREDHLRVLSLHEDGVPPAVVKRATWGAYFQSGVRYLAAQALPEARGEFRAALRYAPMSAATWIYFVAACLPPAVVGALLRLRRRVHAAFLNTASPRRNP